MTKTSEQKRILIDSDFKILRAMIGDYYVTQSHDGGHSVYQYCLPNF
jgi:hypothetical protein